MMKAFHYTKQGFMVIYTLDNRQIGISVTIEGI